MYLGDVDYIRFAGVRECSGIERTCKNFWMRPKIELFSVRFAADLLDLPATGKSETVCEISALPSLPNGSNRGVIKNANAKIPKIVHKARRTLTCK